jgi:hypothetical protein
LGFAGRMNFNGIGPKNVGALLAAPRSMRERKINLGKKMFVGEAALFFRG